MNNFQISPQLIQMLKNGNPQQIVMGFLQQNAKVNPMMENLANMASSGNEAGVIQLCKNLIRSRGMDPDELMKNFQSKFK